MRGNARIFNRGEMPAFDFAAISTKHRHLSEIHAAPQYARLMGVSEAVIRQAMRAAAVVDKIRAQARILKSVHKHDISMHELTTRTRHLYEISQAPDYAWDSLVSLLSDESYTAQKIAATTKRVKEILDAVPDWWSAD
jgi:hypothetical protein